MKERIHSHLPEQMLSKENRQSEPMPRVAESMESSDRSAERRVAIAVPLTQGKYTLIDREDAWILGENEKRPKKWFYYHGKAAHTITDQTGKGKNVLLHREIMERQLGRPLHRSDFVSHINEDELDNRRENLLYLTASEHVHRQKAKYGYKGVTIDHNRWRASITIDGKSRYLGSYATPEEAAQAYNEAALTYFGEKARLNEIPSREEQTIVDSNQKPPPTNANLNNK